MYRCGSIGPLKNRKLLIPVWCTTRKFYLQPPPPGRNDWHVRFVPACVDGVPQEIFRSTGTKEIPAAKRIAAQIIESRASPSELRQRSRTLQPKTTLAPSFARGKRLLQLAN